MFNVFSMTAEPQSLRHSSEAAACNCTCSTLLTDFSSFMLAGILIGDKISSFMLDGILIGDKILKLVFWT